MLVDACDEAEYFLLPFCYSQCPKHFYAVNRTRPPPAPAHSPALGRAGGACLRCHVTCLRCSGPAHNQCVNCSAHRRLTSAHWCVDVDAAARHQLSVLSVVAVAVLAAAVVGVVVVSVVQWLLQRRPASNK